MLCFFSRVLGVSEAILSSAPRPVSLSELGGNQFSFAASLSSVRFHPLGLFLFLTLPSAS